MKVTTTRAFRRHYLNSYSVADFDTFEDYFLYLHLNPRVQWIHVLGGIAVLPLFPWVVYQGVHLWDPWPFLLFSLWFYGAGFASHWLGDGLISKTVKDFGPSYLYVIALNFRVVMGFQAAEEARWLSRYPHMRWVYQAECPPPFHSEVVSTKPTDSLSPAGTPFTDARRAQLGLGSLLLLGLALTQWLPFVGWGLVFSGVFLVLCFPLLRALESEQLLWQAYKQEIGDHLPLVIELSQRRLQALPLAAGPLAGLQQSSTEPLSSNPAFWYHYRQSRRQLEKQQHVDPQAAQQLAELQQRAQQQLLKLEAAVQATPEVRPADKQLYV